MRYLVILVFLLALSSQAVFAQDYKKHTVEKGETVISISKKYQVTPYDIYRLNPDAKNGIKENTILLIPSAIKTSVPATAPKEKTTKLANTIHEVQPKETLYSLSKKYDVSADDIIKANNGTLANGLQIGQKIIIPIKGSAVAAKVEMVEKQEEKKNAPSYAYHTVEAGDTKYSIAKHYGMTLQLLEELNPEVKDTLPIGYRLKLDPNAIIKKEGLSAIPSKEFVPEYMVYKVAPKETFYSLTRKTGLTEEEIIALNPEAKDGLKEGMELRLPKTAGTVRADITNKAVSNLLNSLVKTTPKELVLLLPFNLSKIENDTARSPQERLRTDNFLNITLDFYAGALMAIDSAKTLGLPLKVRILDSNETKSSADISSSVGTANAVIGPFFQINVEKTASMLASKNIPVISPLSKETGRPYPNLFQSVPTDDRVKQAMLDYLKAKGGNIIAVVDAKKGSSRQFIKERLPAVRFASLNDGGTVNESALRAMLVKDTINYVILETEKTGMVLNTTKILTDALRDYPIQLVVLEKTETLDHTEVPLSRLTTLKMLYPSVTKDNETEEGAVFAKEFKKKNNIFPNQFATRGFDVTFDVILRLFQQEGFTEIMSAITSEQVESKFSYRKENEGNYNAGVYIMYYDEDLSVKQAQ